MAARQDSVHSALSTRHKCSLRYSTSARHYEVTSVNLINGYDPSAIDPSVNGEPFKASLCPPLHIHYRYSRNIWKWLPYRVPQQLRKSKVPYLFKIKNDCRCQYK